MSRDEAAAATGSANVVDSIIQRKLGLVKDCLTEIGVHVDVPDDNSSKIFELLQKTKEELNQLARSDAKQSTFVKAMQGLFSSDTAKKELSKIISIGMETLPIKKLNKRQGPGDCQISR